MDLPEAVLAGAALLAGAVLLGRGARAVGLPLTVVLTVTGALAAASGVQADLVQGEVLEEVLVTVFLPVLVFAAALGLSTRAFLRDLAPIAVLATVAVLVSAALVAVAVGPLLGLPLPVALLFGVITAATDPVAVVAIFQRLGVPRRLLTLVEGESLLNDGVAIVGASVVLAAVQGSQVGVGETVARFVVVFGGGTLVGLVLGLAVAAVLPFLDPLPAVALTLAVAYGGFVGAEELLGFSGVMATVASGCVVSLFLPSRGTAELREALHPVWEQLDWVANALLFLLLGLALDLRLLVEELPAVLLAVVATLLARPLAVVPLLALLSRVFGVRRVGWRNEAVLVWGGLRGSVALALVLALPQDVPRRDTLVAMTAGIVLVTLLLNATTIGALVRRLGLAEPPRTERWTAVAVRRAALRDALGRLDELEATRACDDAGAGRARLAELERRADEELADLRLAGHEQQLVVARTVLEVQRRTYQRLSDEGLLDPEVARRLLHEADDALDEAAMGAGQEMPVPSRGTSAVDRVVQAVLTRLPRPPGTAAEALRHDEAAARRLGQQEADTAAGRLRGTPGMSGAAVDEVLDRLGRAHEEAMADAPGGGSGSSSSSPPGGPGPARRDRDAARPQVPVERDDLLAAHLATSAVAALEAEGLVGSALAERLSEELRAELSTPAGGAARR